MDMNAFCRRNISNIVLLVINIIYLTIGASHRIDYLRLGDRSAGLGLFIYMSVLIGVACVLFIPIALAAKHMNKNMSKRFYTINYISFIYITTAIFISIFL